LLFMRCLIGIFESLAFPAIFQFIPIWIPLEEKTLMVPFIYSGMYVGTIVSFSVSSEMLETVIMMGSSDFGGWDACFYVFGLLGIAWFPYWAMMAYETPRDHPGISAEELTLINEGKHFPGEKEVTDLMISTRTRRPSFSPLVPVTVYTASEHDLEMARARKGSHSSTGSGNHALPLVTEGSPATSVPRRKPSQSQGLTALQERDGDFDCQEKDDKFRSDSQQVDDIVQYNDIDYEDDDEDPEHSYPIALESVALNMIRSASSKHARLDGKLSHMSDKTKSGKDGAAVATGGTVCGTGSGMSGKQIGTRPRKLTIVTEAKVRQSLASHIPWKHFFTHPVSITLFVNCWVDGFIGYTLLSVMPLFLQDQFGFNLQSAGVLCVFPYLALFFSTLSFGGFFELLQEHFPNVWTLDMVRKTASFVAYGGAAGGLILCAFLTEKNAGYAFMIITQFLLGASSTGLGCAFSDVAPNYSSALNTVGNTIGAVAGIIGPLIISALVEQYEGSWGWRYAFFLTAGQVAIALAMWYKYQTSQPVPALNEPLQD
jgi:MFS family permease